MKKDGVTYSNRPRRRSDRAVKQTKVRKRFVPRWVPYGATALLTFVLCLSINFRAFTELSREVQQNENLNTEIDKVTSENLNLQEEIYYLENDTSVIEREAKKFGIRRQNKEKQVSVPTAK